MLGKWQSQALYESLFWVAILGQSDLKSSLKTPEIQRGFLRFFPVSTSPGPLQKLGNFQLPVDMSKLLKLSVVPSHPRVLKPPLN